MIHVLSDLLNCFSLEYKMQGCGSRKRSNRLSFVSPNRQLLSQLQSIPTHWPVPNYTAWWQKHATVNDLTNVVLWESQSQSSYLYK